MSEAELLGSLAHYGLEAPTLAAAFDADPERAWSLVAEASYHHAEWFVPEVRALLEARFADGPRAGFTVWHNLDAMDRFLAFFPSHPAAAIDAFYYVCANTPERARPAHVRALCEQIPADACQAFRALQFLLFRRPELIDVAVVEAVVRHLGGQVNQAFALVRELLKARPEFTSLCTLALFECVVREPHPAVRHEMIGEVAAIARSAHVRADLERTLREPPAVGSRRARALMALLFRQKLRARQRVLLEALLHAAGYTPWAERHWTPLWDFFLELVDRSDPRAIATAAAETFLEGAFQLVHLSHTPAEYESFARRLDLRDAPPASFPAPAEFLDREPGLAELHGRAALLASRFGTALDLAPLREFAARAERAGRELAALEERCAGCDDPGRRRGWEARRAALAERLERWRDPAYARALGDAAAEAALPPAFRAHVRAERRELAKRVGAHLRHRLAAIAVDAVRVSARELYRARLRDLLGREVDPDRVEPAILPSLLFFRALQGMPNNTRGLARLIEDRVEGRPHVWLWTEPPAAEWRRRVAAAQPGLRFERWRAAFTRTYATRPADAAAERARRIRADREQARAGLIALGVEGLERADAAALRRAFEEARRAPPEGADPAAIEEIGFDLERARIAEAAPDADFEGEFVLTVETDPFEVLFMGEYGFASCLSLRGPNVWSAVSNAIDVDKAIVWAKDPAGNVVGRRLIALLPEGMVAFRTYSNRPGLALDGLFEDFLREYAEHCGARRARRVSPGPLLSDRWYDDGAL